GKAGPFSPAQKKRFSRSSRTRADVVWRRTASAVRGSDASTMGCRLLFRQWACGLPWPRATRHGPARAGARGAWVGCAAGGRGLYYSKLAAAREFGVLRVRSLPPVRWLAVAWLECDGLE